MKPSYKDMLLQILTVMEYDEKERYAAEVEEMNFQEAVINCLEKLPVSLKEKIKTNGMDIHESIKMIPEEILEQERIKVSAQALLALLRQMEAVLSSDQKEKIVEIVASY